MNLLSLKIHKAYTALKRDGLLTTSHRIGEAILKSLKPVGSGEILIVTGGIGDSARYRAYHQAEERTLNGQLTKVTIQDNPFLKNFVSRFNQFIFHRVLYTPHVMTMIAEIKRQNKKIIFDTDDLVYDPQYLPHMDYYQKMSPIERELYKNGVGGEILNDPYVTEGTTSTEFLAVKLREKLKSVKVRPNKLCQRDIQIVDKLLDKNQRRDNIIKIGYFSGTRSHDLDFQTIAEPLLKILTEFPAVRLVIAGPLTIDSRFLNYKNQIIRLPFTNRRQHFKNLSTINLNLIPLEVGNPFCEAKSEIKFIEAGLLGICSVASATDTYKRIDPQYIKIAHNQDAWYSILKKHITVHQLLACDNKLHDYILQNYTTQYKNHA